jgi:hypothetical protein
VTRTPPRPDIGRHLRSLTDRVGRLERSGRDVITPVSTTAATINQTSAQTPFMAYINPSGASLTWWVLVTPTAGATTTLQLRADDGVTGDPVAADPSAASVVAVSLVIPDIDTWQPGTQHLIYLDAWIDANSATVVPVRALIS